METTTAAADEVQEVAAPRASAALPKRCQLSDERLLCIVECANAQNYPVLQHKHGKKKKTQEQVLAQMMLKPDLWKPPPSLETTFAWLDKFVSKRKVETGARGDKDHTGAGDEEAQDAEAAGRDDVDFNSPLSVALDEFIRMEQEYFDDEDAAKASNAARDKLGEDLMAEAMGGCKRPIFHQMASSSVDVNNKKKKTGGDNREGISHFYG
ncbi:hypothetical protein AB1Y20_022769 [Prymnesium parvum]|uniref:Uncharacterized protein n=1 Tax=Prymnesium parvum TaxID=97485 RepID=A0AB34JGT3_PRYPA